MSDLPSGTVTFLFTDLEGSTRLWEEHPDAMRGALARHDAILRGAVKSHGGALVKTTGDGIYAAFATARRGADAAVAMQRGLMAESWGETGVLQVRIGLHTGEADQRDGDYFGPALNRAARLMAVAHGGQIIASQATESVLRDDVPEGVELLDLGEHRLRDLSRPERVFQVSHPDLPRAFARLRSLESAPGNLPLQVTSFVGRNREQMNVTSALGDSRVVTLTGVGGVGKTRLALHVATNVQSRYRDGVWLCELSGVHDPDAVPEAVLAAFNLQGRPGITATDTVLDLLRTKQLLVVLDNCEHLLSAAARLVSAIERTCPAVQFLATSREGLDIDGERIVVVPSLATPQAADDFEAMDQTDSVRLFVDRAQAVSADFALSPVNAGQVAQLCRRLDGVPLAIELAAARIPTFTPSELADRLDQRFEILTGGRRTAVERHQTLRAALDWSYDLLDDEERILLARLGVFVGGFTMEAAEKVTYGEGVERDAVWELLARLVARSLVVVDHGATETRYRLLETVRQYALDRLDDRGDTARTRREHAHFYAGFAEMAVPALWTADEVAWTIRIDGDLENIRTAMDWAIAEGDVDTAIRILSLSCDNATPWCSRFNPTIAPVAEAAVAIPGAAEHPKYPAALAAAAFLVVAWQGDYDLAGRLSTEALDAERRLGTAPIAYPWIVRSNVAMARGSSPDEYIAEWETAIAVMRRRGSPELASDLGFLAALRTNVGGPDNALAQAEAEEALALARQQGAPGVVASALAASGMALAESDPKRSMERVREAMDIERSRGWNAVSMTFAIASEIAGRHGTLQERLEVYRETLERLSWAGIGPGIYPILGRVAELLAAEDPPAAAVVFGGLATMTAVSQVAGEHLAERADALAALTSALGEERLVDLQALGANMSDSELVTHTRSAIDRCLAQ